jgi:hypothetical protein
MSRSILEYLEESQKFKHRTIVTKDGAKSGKIVGMKTGEQGITVPIQTKVDIKQDLDQKSKDDLKELDSPVTVTKSVPSN